MGERGGELGQKVMEKPAVKIFPAGNFQKLRIFQAGADLLEHHVDARHILSPERAEEMRGSVAQAHMRAVVLDDMTDILYAAFAAPAADLLAEIDLKAAADLVHVGKPRRGAQPVELIPAGGQHRREAFAPGRAQARFDFSRPAQRHGPVADLRHADDPAAGVADLRLVREKAGDGLAEFGLIMRVVRLVADIQQEADHVAVENVHMRQPVVAVIGRLQHKDAPEPLRHIPEDGIALRARRQIDGFEHPVRIGAVAPAGDDAYETLLALQPQHEGAPRRGADDVDAVMIRQQLARLRKFAQAAVEIAGGEMRVVQNPDAHGAFFRFIQNDIQIAPPLRADKIGVRPRFDAEFADAGGGDLRDAGANLCLFFSMHPQEGENRVSRPALQRILEHFHGRHLRDQSSVKLQ